MLLPFSQGFLLAYAFLPLSWSFICRAIHGWSEKQGRKFWGQLVTSDLERSFLFLTCKEEKLKQPCEHQSVRKRRRISCSRPRTIESPAVCGRDHSGEDILLQSMERNTPKQISTLQAVEDPGTEQVYPEGLQLMESSRNIWGGRNSREEFLWTETITPIPIPLNCLKGRRRKQRSISEWRSEVEHGIISGGWRGGREKQLGNKMF